MTLPRLLAVAAITLAAAPGFAADPPPPVAGVSYYKDVRPLFQQNCQGCHQPAKAQGGFVMTDVASLLRSADSDKPGVVPGKPENSYLLDEIRVADGKAEMPKNGSPLTAAQYAVVETWIRQGAIDDTPASAKATAIDAEHPPVYSAPPVVTSLAFSPDGKRLAVTGYHEVLVYSADGKKLEARLVGLSERVQALAFSPDGKWLAAAGGDPGRFGEVQVWDVEKARLKLAAPITFDTLYGLSWSPDGTKLAFGCADNTVRAVDALTGKQVLQMGTHSDWVLGTTFSRDGQHLISVSRDMSTKLTEVATQRFIDNVTSITPGALKGGLIAIDIRPNTEKKVAKVPDDSGKDPQDKPYDEVVIAGADGIPRLYKIHRETKRVIGDDANKVRDLAAMPGRISAVKFDADGGRVAAVSSLDGKGEVAVFDANTGKKIATGETATGPLFAVAWAPDGKRIASAGFDGVVRFHDPATGKLLGQFTVLPK
jgi:WD40 repeat protein